MKNIEEGKEIYSIDIQSNRMFIETDNLTIIDIEDMSIYDII